MDKSIWNENIERIKYSELNGDIECEILIIGGGIAGVLTAYYLQKAGRNVVLVEGSRIGSGMTANTTAVITAQHDSFYKDIIKKYGVAVAKNYLDANLHAVKQFKELVKNEAIDCDFEVVPSTIYSISQNLSDEIDALKLLGYEAKLVFDTDLPFDIASGVEFADMAVFHPLKFLFAIAQKLKVYENTFVTKLDKNIAYTKNGNIKFAKAVVATHFPFINSHGLFFAKMHQKRSYVMALEGVAQPFGTFMDDKEQGFYFRNYKDMLLVGKGEHRTGTKTNALEELEAFRQKFYPNSKVKCMWANQDCVTLDEMPYIGNYGNLKNVFVTTGFNLWGMTGSMVGAQILKDIVCDKENEFAKTFCPSRRIIRLQLFENIASVFVNMIYPTTKRCPHLGCALKYNKREHSWDCSCHGSRFEKDGKLINNPAMHNKKL